ncbi:MAG: ABC transporter ATP-binding protein [Candidatus Heimdallarchaeota archaeon]
MIKCLDVIKIYTDEDTNSRIAALRGVDLTINDGELISIIGPSGSGKSTLIKILAGIESLSSGEVNVNGHDLGSMSTKDLLEYRLRYIGLVHQFPERTLFLSGTVGDNLAFSAGLYSKDLENNKIRNKEIMETLGIDHLENRRVSFLSGGEMIRTAIACMLAKNAKLLLCDEPTGQLDTENTNKVKDLLRKISRDFGTTVLVVTHDLRFLTGVDKTCEIHSGRVSSLFSGIDSTRFNITDFPLELVAQIDSTQNVRIPDEVYDVLQIGSNMKFIINEDSTIEIKHPKDLPPKILELSEMRKQKKLDIKALPDDYFDGRELDIMIRNASKIYGKKDHLVHAVSKIDFEIMNGELAFIIGPSGSGKTTIIKLITGMVPSSMGEIVVLNQNLHELSDNQRSKFRRSELGIVSQQGDLHPTITVRKNLFIKQLLAGNRINLNNLPQEEVDSILNMFQIEHRQDSFPLEISGGELQRASLAIAKFGEPKILILDEPTANMDSELAENIMKQLYDIHKRLGITLLITTHDINLVKDGTRVIELEDGTIKRDGLAYSTMDAIEKEEKDKKKTKETPDAIDSPEAVDDLKKKMEEVIKEQEKIKTE